MLDRRGVCLSCHKTIPNGSLAVDLLHHVKEMSDAKINTEDHNNLMHKMLMLSAWVQVSLGAIVLLAVGFMTRKYFFKRRT